MLGNQLTTVFEERVACCAAEMEVWAGVEQQVWELLLLHTRQPLHGQARSSDYERVTSFGSGQKLALRRGPITAESTAELYRALPRLLRLSAATILRSARHPVA